MSKPTVHYSGEAVVRRVGQAAWLTPLDHPNHMTGHHVSNTMPVHTSAVESFNEKTGAIETRNTSYVPSHGATMRVI